MGRKAVKTAKVSKRELAVDDGAKEAQAPAALPQLLDRRDAWTALALGLVTAVLYALTACRTVYGGDSGEFAIVFDKLGVAHPPGYPLLTLLSIPLVRALDFLSPAFAANLLSGLWGASAVALAYLFSRRMGRKVPGSLFAASCLAVGRTFWSQSVVAEAYSFDILLLFVALLAAPFAAARATRKAWFLFGLAVGFWLGHRTVNVIYLPAVALVFLGMGRASLPRRFWLFWILGGAVSGLVYLYIPIASAGHPVLNFGFIRTFDDFVGHVTGRGFGYLLHRSNDREWLRIGVFLSSLPYDVALAAPFALAAALSALWRRSRAGKKVAQKRSRAGLVGVGLLVLLAANLLFASRYDIPDIEVYFLASHVALCLLSARGFDGAFSRAPASWQSAPRTVGALAACAVLALGAALNGKVNDLSDDPQLQLFAEDLLASADGGGVLFVQGDTVANSLYYLQFCEDKAPKGTAVVYAPLEQRWYREQLAVMYPDHPWPDVRDTETWERRVVRIIDANIDARPIYFSSELDANVVMRRGDGVAKTARSLVLLQKGLVREVRVQGRPYDIAAYADESVAQLESFAARARGLPMHVEIDTKISYLQYAYALKEAGAMLERPRPDLAERAYRALLSLVPDTYEVAYQEEQGWRTGEKIPAIGLEKMAREGLERLKNAPKSAPKNAPVLPEGLRP